jgi:serine/threonine protein kinase
VAVTVLPPEIARDEELVRQFDGTAAAAARLHHRNVASVLFSGEDAGRHFFAREWVEGESLAARLSGQPRPPLKETLAIIEQCLAGLQAAHAGGLIHQDLRPGNILLEGDTGRVVLTGFGLTARVGTDDELMGTVDYCPPEQARDEPVDARGDVYSLGVVFYQMLAGRLPFQAGTPTEMLLQHAHGKPLSLQKAAPDAPRRLVEIVQRMMTKNPADRYPSCAAVLEDLKAFRGTQSPSAIPTMDGGRTADSSKPKSGDFSHESASRPDDFDDDPDALSADLDRLSTRQLRVLADATDQRLATRRRRRLVYVAALAGCAILGLSVLIWVLLTRDITSPPAVATPQGDEVEASDPISATPPVDADPSVKTGSPPEIADATVRSAPEEDARPVASPVEEPVEEPPADPPPPPKKSPEELRAALSQIRNLLYSRSPDFYRALREVWDEFPIVPAVASVEDVEWQKVQLNATGARFDAVRFQSPFDEPAEMRWAFGYPTGVVDGWQIVPANGSLRGFTGFRRLNHVALPGVDLPENNTLILQALSGGHIRPGREYLLYFTFPLEQSTEISLVIRLVPASQAEPVDSSLDVAPQLGLQLPFETTEPTTAQSFLERAQQAGMRRDYVTALELAERGLELEPNHLEGFYWTAAFSHILGQRLSSRGEREEAERLFLQAGKYIRMLRDGSDHLAPRVAVHIAPILYCEARALAMAGDADRAADSLAEAIDAGFAEFRLLVTDDVWAPCRETPKFRELIDSLKQPAFELGYELAAHPADAVEFKGHWYKVFPGKVRWDEAQQRCQELGGYLVCIEDQAELQFVAEQWEPGNLWLGGLKKGRRWYWAHGKPLLFENWQRGEPNNASGKDDYLKNDARGFWHDVPHDDGNIQGFICEWEL